MENEIMSEVTKPQSKDQTGQITNSDSGVDSYLLMPFHGNDISYKIYFRSDDSHGNGVVEQDYPAFTLSLNQV